MHLFDKNHAHCENNLFFKFTIASVMWILRKTKLFKLNSNKL